MAAGHTVIQVFHDTFYGCRWHSDISALYDPVRGYGPAGDYDPAIGKGMYNARLGKDPSKGKFYVFDKDHAAAVLTLLVENSYVRFGEQVFKQTRGIPMGINPAVYMANYYLFYYEYKFIEQMVQLIVNSNAAGVPVSTDPSELPVQEVLRLLKCSNSTAVAQSHELHGTAAMFLLHNYRCTVRFVDDFTSGPNPFTGDLLYEHQTLMGGMIHGIYPGQFLVLESTPGDGLFSFSTLDVRIVTEVSPVTAADGSQELVVKSHTLLFDKRRLACYRGIPIVQYAHVASTLSLHCGYNILIGQLHRFRGLITVRANYVLEVSRLLLRMQSRGYRYSILWRKLRHHLRLYPDTYGDTGFKSLLTSIRYCVTELREYPCWESACIDWTGWYEDSEHMELEEVSEIEETESSSWDSESELVEMDVDG